MHQRNLPLEGTIPDARDLLRRAPESLRDEFDQATGWPALEATLRACFAGKRKFARVLFKARAVRFAAWLGHDPVKLGRWLFPIRDLAFVRYDQRRGR